MHGGLGEGLKCMSTRDDKISFDSRFLLYLLGTGAWLSFTTFSGSSYSAALVGDDLFTRIAQTACFSLSFFIVATFDYLRGPFRRYALVCVVAVSFALSFGSRVAYDAFVLPDEVLYVAAACLAFGSACGYCQWLRLLAGQGYRRAQWLLALGSLLLIAIMFGYELLPKAAQEAVTFGVLAPVSVVLLVANVRLCKVKGEGDKAPRAVNGFARTIKKDLLLPIVCAMALVLITPIASITFGTATGEGLASSGFLLPIAHACSLALLMVVWFGFRRDITLPKFYCVFLPIFASLIFLLPLLDASQTWIILFVGDGCFFFVSVLMVTTCLAVSHRRRLSAIVLYGLFAGCVYLSNVVQLALELLSQSGFLHFESYAVALLLLYVLVIPAFFIVAVGRSRKARAALGGIDPMSKVDRPSASELVGQRREGVLSDTEHACASIAKKRALPVRQAEVLALLALGRDVAYIANDLYLSPNTVRSYRKALYAALKIHSKQELIDLVEEERRAILSSPKEKMR